MSLPKYKDWSPTPVDPRGLGADRLDRADWGVCPVMITRDTPAHSIDASNWRALQLLLVDATGQEDGEKDWETHRFGHWGPGWFEILLVRPETRAWEAAEEVCGRLEDYAVLDEEGFAQGETEATIEDIMERLGIDESQAYDVFRLAWDEGLTPCMEGDGSIWWGKDGTIELERIARECGYLHDEEQDEDDE